MQFWANFNCLITIKSQNIINDKNFEICKNNDLFEETNECNYI
jgi:hypothetical protein